MWIYIYLCIKSFYLFKVFNVNTNPLPFASLHPFQPKKLPKFGLNASKDEPRNPPVLPGMRGVGLAGLLGLDGLGLEVLVGWLGLLVVAGAVVVPLVVVALAVEFPDSVDAAGVDVDVELDTVVLSVASVVAAELSSVDCDSDNREMHRMIKQM